MRALVERAFRAALDAVDARRATAAVLRARPVAGPVHVLALGKAAMAMTAGALDACDVAAGLVIAPIGGPELPLPPSLEVLRGRHPVPDADVARRGEALLARAAAIGADQTVVVLVSGGGSALVDAPVPGIDAGGLASLTERLLACGASIDELNAIRVSMSRSKGGGLARALAGRAVRVIVVSDIASGDASRVASGPMSPWRGPAPRDVAARAHVATVLTEAERRFVDAWTDAGTLGAPLEVAADNAMAVQAAIARLRADALDVAAGPVLAGEARTCGRAWASAARASSADALVAGGETVVTLHGRGRGGRNQETALAALEAGIPGTFLCAGTDGIDGPTEAAGGVIDDDVRARARTLDVAAALADNDSNRALAACGGLLVTGPTGTNVADVAIWARDGRGSR